MVMYSELEQEFNKPMHEAGLAFTDEYTKALKSFEGIEFYDREQKYKALQAVLQTVLEQYTASEPTTRAGRFFRKAGRVALLVIPFLKYIKFKRK